MDWRRRQIRRTAPKHRIKNPYVILNEAEHEERQWWREIHYHSGISCYEGHLRILEQDFHCLSPRLSQETADRIRGKIECYLGRPLRTMKQMKEDFKVKRNVEFLEKEDPHAAP